VSDAFDVSYRTDAAGRVVKRVAARAPARSVANDTLLLKMASGLEGVNLENSPDGTLRHTNTLCELPFDPATGTYSMKAWDGDLVRSAAFRGFNELHLEVTNAQGEPAGCDPLHSRGRASRPVRSSVPSVPTPIDACRNVMREGKSGLAVYGALAKS
jgi:hypothetical protein